MILVTMDRMVTRHHALHLTVARTNKSKELEKESKDGTIDEEREQNDCKLHSQMSSYTLERPAIRTGELG